MTLGSSFNSSPPLKQTLGGRSDVQAAGSLPAMGVTEMLFLALAWPHPSCCEHLGSKRMAGSLLPLSCLSLPLEEIIFKIIKKLKIFKKKIIMIQYIIWQSYIFLVVYFLLYNFILSIVQENSVLC